MFITKTSTRVSIMRISEGNTNTWEFGLLLRPTEHHCFSQLAQFLDMVLNVPAVYRVKLSLCLTKHYAMKTCGGVEV
jgi:hypothetical protein